MTFLHQGVGQLQQQLHLLPGLAGLLLEGVVLHQQLLGLLVSVAHLGVSAQVDISLLLDPSQSLSCGALEQNILLILVQPFLFTRPIFENSIFLSQQLFQNY